MSDNGYLGTSTPERKWGCLTSVFVSVPVFCFLLLRDALGDCASDTVCEKGFVTQVFLPSVLIGSVAGLVIYGLIKLISRRRS